MHSMLDLNLALQWHIWVLQVPGRTLSKTNNIGDIESNV